MATFHPLHPQPHLLSSCLCKSSSALLPCNSHFITQASPFPCPKYALNPGLSRLLVVNPLHDVSPLTVRFHQTPKWTPRFGRSRKIRHGLSSSRLDNTRVHNNLVKTSDFATVNKSVEKGVKSDGKTRRRLDSSNRRRNESGSSSDRPKDANSATNSLGLRNAEEGNGKVEGKSVKGGQRNNQGKKLKRSSSNKNKDDTVDTKIRYQFEMCSKAGDVMGAISLYDSATKKGIKLGQYHYTMVLYLCSSAALGVVRPAKSGSGSRSMEMLVPSNRGSSLDSGDLFESEESFDSEEEEDEDDDAYSDPDMKEQNVKQNKAEILVSESVKKYALERGYEVYERMCLESIPMNEAILTSVARMAMAMGDGDKAFDMVKQMKALGINPKLRSYGPALSVFCSQGELEKAFEVERHMLDHGVQPEEPELEALLRVSVDVGKPDEIYYLLHKLRTAVRSVSPSTADLIQKWFESTEASRVGNGKWDQKTVIETMESVGGGWHGLGWLSSGKWSVSRTIVEEDGSCKCCGEKLALIDLDPKETEKFAESVAAIASKREKNSSFQKFQRWLDYYGPFEAVVDAANVGLYSQKSFRLSKVKAVVNGIRQMLTSRKWPLVVLHNRRISGPKMDEPMNRAIIERWKIADALYSTPTGSNDDWYWLYAAIKYKCLLVTNDEMRDHIFQLLGNDFFPRWKERHQVRFSFSEVGPVFHMPPPCSVVIQESERGNWHIPVVSNHQSEGERTWLCIRRITLSARAAKEDHLTASPVVKEQDNDNQYANSSSETEDEMKDEQKTAAAKQAQKSYVRNRNTTRESFFPSYRSILADLEFAEEQSGCVIDFQI